MYWTKHLLLLFISKIPVILNCRVLKVFIFTLFSSFNPLMSFSKLDFLLIHVYIWNQDLDEPLLNFYGQYYFDNGDHHVDFSMPGSSKNNEKSQ